VQESRRFPGNKETLADLYADTGEKRYLNLSRRFRDVTHSIPKALTQGKDKVTVRFQAHPGSWAGGLFGVRIVLREAPGQKPEDEGKQVRRPRNSWSSTAATKQRKRTHAEAQRRREKTRIDSEVYGLISLRLCASA
jgi:hypothetical protein